MAWQLGDRVWVNPTTERGGWVQATVREIDPHGRPGVLLDLDHPIRGISTCTATHAELRAVDTVTRHNRRNEP